LNIIGNMRALVEISDKQFFVTEGDKLFIPTQKAEAGDTLTFEKVLLQSDGAAASLTPSCKVTAKLLRHVKGDKVTVFKKKRRKRYRVTRGHRQGFSEIEILSVA